MSANVNNVHEIDDNLGNRNKFPTHIFQKELQEIMNEFNKVLNLNYDFMGVSILFAFSLAIGNHFRIQIKKKWIESAVIWVALVGKAGINKSAPLSIFIEPFRELDKLFYQKYKEELTKYNEQMFKRKAKIKNPEGCDTNQNELKSFNSEPPHRKQYLISDFTPEALSVAHEDNQSGIGIYSDELLTWINNFNRYTKSGEEQFYLSIWSCREININRRNSPHIYIPNPFINVIGTIQPEKLIDTFGKGRDNSGFTHRILFAFPDNITREDLSDSDVPDIYVKVYSDLIQGIINRRINSSPRIDPKILVFEKSAEEEFKAWRSDNNKRINQCSNDTLCGIYSKLEIYLLRVALILQIIKDECEKRESEKITLKSMLASIELIRYFECTATKVSKLISKYNDPLMNYALDKRMVYMALPNEFSTNKGEEIATKLNMARRTFFEFLGDDYLFEKQKHGYYFKKV